MGTHRRRPPPYEAHVSTSNTSFNQDVFKLELGVDKLLSESENGKLIAGLNAHYVHGRTDTRSPHGNGEIRTDGYGLGATLTWYKPDGWYMDGQARVTWYDSDLRSKLAHRSLVRSNDGFGYAASVESGKRIALNESLSIMPQAQLTYSNINFDSFIDTFGARVSRRNGHSLQGRLGISLDHESSRVNAHGTPIRTHVYGIANLYYELMNATTVKVANAYFNSRSDRLWTGLGVGGSYNWNKDKYSLYGEASVNTSLNRFADNYSFIARIGVRVRW